MSLLNRGYIGIYGREIYFIDAYNAFFVHFPGDYELFTGNALSDSSNTVIEFTGVDYPDFF